MKLLIELESANKALNYPQVNNEYWATERGRTTRTVLANIAKRRNLDPLLAETWYSIPRQSVLHEQVSNSLIMSLL